MRWIAGAVVVLVAATAGCGDGDTAAPPARATVQRFIAAHPNAVVHSDSVKIGSDEIAVVGEQRAKDRVIDVVSLAGKTPRTVAELPLPAPPFDFADALPVQAMDETDVYFARDPTFANGTLITQFNDCVPNCADGEATPVRWRYDRDGTRFVAS